MKAIKALSFDLDDTLYNNAPVIENAYQALYQYLLDNLINKDKHFSFEYFIQLALKVKNNHPAIFDLKQLRLLHIREILQQSNTVSNSTIEEAAFEVFFKARQQVIIEPSVFDLLQKLSTKLPMIVISNGNADFSQIGLTQYFQFAVQPSNTLQPKPHPQMFFFACQQLKIQPHQLLHIGDSLETDIKGAQEAGCRSVWFNPNKKSLSNGKIDQQIHQLDELLNLFF